MLFCLSASEALHMALYKYKYNDKNN